MPAKRDPLARKIREQLDLEGYEPEPCELAHLAAEPYEPVSPYEPDHTHTVAVDLDGSTEH